MSNFPPAGRTDDLNDVAAPLEATQATAVSPSAFIATNGWIADSASLESTAALEKLPVAAGRVASSTSSLAAVVPIPDDRGIAGVVDRHPWRSGAFTARREAHGGAEAPPAGRNDAWTIPSEPSRRVQATMVSPRSFIATVGNKAFFPGAESFTGAEGIPSVTVAASTM